MTTKTKKKLKIHSENILPIIKKWLYSEKDIFVRELVSNACDAISKLKHLKDIGEVKDIDGQLRIDIDIDAEKKILKFSDTGIGMNGKEVEKYIAQIAFSGAEDFMEKYQTQKEGDQMIGHFGLGFYSSYMVSSKVEIDTLSYKDKSKAALWSCDGSPEYELIEGQRKQRGTEISLFIDEDNQEYLDANNVRKILDRFCAFLPYPIFLNGSQINKKDPLWLKPSSECSKEEYVEFYRQLYPFEEEPLFWIHLNVDYPFHLKGILYFPKMRKDFDFSKNNIKLFCNRVFVSDSCKDLIPEYLTVLKGAIDSPDIPLNVSRSYLQMDRTVRQLSQHISKKVADRLSSLYKTDREKFLEAWEDVNLVVKLGAMQDDKFYNKVKDFLIFQNLEGQWTTVEEYLENNAEKNPKKVFYTQKLDDQSQFLQLYKKQGVEVLVCHHPIDKHLIGFLESKQTDIKIQRIDGALDEAICDSSRENTLLDAEGKTQSGKLADFIRSKIEDKDLEITAKSLADDHLPAFIVFDEQARRMRDYMLSADPNKLEDADKLVGKKNFVVNTNNKLIQSLPSLSDEQPTLAKELLEHIYDLALLSQQEMTPNRLANFVSRSSQVLEKLAQKATEK